MNAKPQLVLCRTCVRDNPADGPFASFEENAKFYQALLKEGFLKKTADLYYQNCFAVCEGFHCVLVYHQNRGILFKKISSEEKMQAIIDWLKTLKAGASFEVPENLKEHVLKEVSEPEDYKKV